MPWGDGPDQVPWSGILGGMRFTTDQMVVHPHHGPARVTGLFTRPVRGEEVHYVQLTVRHRELELSLPVEKANELGVRPLLGAEEVGALFARLVAESGFQETQWSRRIKQDVDRLNSGDALVVAALVRDLLRRERDKGLSLGERDLLRDARRPVVEELSIVLGQTEEDTLAVVRAAALDGVLPDLGADGTLRTAS